MLQKSGEALWMMGFAILTLIIPKNPSSRNHFDDSDCDFNTTYWLYQMWS